MHTDEKYLCNHTKGRDVDIAHPKKLKNRYEKKRGETFPCMHFML